MIALAALALAMTPVEQRQLNALGEYAYVVGYCSTKVSNLAASQASFVNKNEEVTKLLFRAYNMGVADSRKQPVSTAVCKRQLDEVGKGLQRVR